MFCLTAARSEEMQFKSFENLKRICDIDEQLMFIKKLQKMNINYGFEIVLNHSKAMVQEIENYLTLWRANSVYKKMLPEVFLHV